MLKIETIRMDYEDMKSKNVQLESELESFKTKLEMNDNELKAENASLKAAMQKLKDESKAELASLNCRVANLF